MDFKVHSCYLRENLQFKQDLQKHNMLIIFYRAASKVELLSILAGSISSTSHILPPRNPPWLPEALETWPKLGSKKDSKIALWGVGIEHLKDEHAQFGLRKKVQPEVYLVGAHNIISGTESNHIMFASSCQKILYQLYQEYVSWVLQGNSELHIAIPTSEQIR